MYEKSGSIVLRDFISKSFIFVGVMLFEKFENKTPSNITRYTVFCSPLSCISNNLSHMTTILIPAQIYNEHLRKVKRDKRTQTRFLSRAKELTAVS